MISLKEGDKAPLFSGIDQDGKKVSLSDFKGRKLV
ncbi:MAG: redoxin domain-containing protein, partial [Bacteroidetes bacterium]|nr:redoxin domain-containing protein [Bacteroidota bacterium]